MLKKMIKGLVLGGALLGMVATAQADTYEINIYGASAQHKFWLNLAPAWLTDANGGNCATAQQAAYNKKHGIARGLNCNIPNGTGDDTIIFRYSSRASYKGVVAINNDENLQMAADETCNWGTGVCTGLEAADVNLGASDVAWDDFTQSTIGFEDGNLANDVYADTPDYEAPDPAGVDPVYPTSGPDGVFNPIVVPFGFIANDTVCKFRCVKPHTWTDTAGNQVDGPITQAGYAASTLDHKAYSHDMWQCDPTQSEADGRNIQCVGNYKCIDTTTGDGTDTRCQGGLRDGRSCTNSSDCPDVDIREKICSVDPLDNLTEADCLAASGTWGPGDNANYLLNTRCEAMPLDNVNDVMVGQIFSGQVEYWKDFGPYFDCKIDADGDSEIDDDLGIFAAMRHGGSGTHATMDDLMQPYTLAQNDSYLGNLKVGDASYPQGYSRIHYTSSSDLTSAVIDFAGGIGYVDADKLLGFKKIHDGQADGPTAAYDEADGIVGAHIVKYNGVEPTRQKIVNCEYGFWAAQHVYYDTSKFPAGTAIRTLRENLESFSSNEANLTEANLGDPAKFWAAQSEMLCKKSKQTGVTKQIVVRK
jgi:hypothetical protein